MPNLSNYNKYILVKAYPILKEGATESSHNFKFQFRVSKKYDWVKENSEFKTTSVQNRDSSKFKEKLYTARCNAKNLRCGPVTLFYNPNIKHLGSSYFQISSISSVKNHLPIEKVEFKYITGEPQFIVFLAWLKIGSFTISVIFLGLYTLRLKKIPEATRVVE